jgi:hypothetical protein
VCTTWEVELGGDEMVYYAQGDVWSSHGGEAEVGGGCLKMDHCVVK